MKYFYDFHIHSALSPCADDDMTPCNIVNMAHLKGLNLIAITDHNSIGNAESAMMVGEKLGITVIPGMEIETVEEVHVLSLFPSLSAAQRAEIEVKASLPKIKNNEAVFGNQLLIDEYDNITGNETQMLITATNLDIYKTFELIKECGGVAILAHVDRHSYSVLSNLGFIPPDLPVSTVEISYNVDDLEQYIKNTHLEKYKIIRNSDAHRLGDISERNNYIGEFDKSLTKIINEFR